MAEDPDIKRFIQAVKLEADKDEDFVLDRVKKTYPTLWNLLESRYKNFNELCEMALKKSEWYERMRDFMREADKQTAHLKMKESPDNRAKRMAFIASFKAKELYDKFMWRYSYDELLKLAKETQKEEQIGDGSVLL